MRTELKYDVGTTFKHPWVRNHDDKKPTTCIVTHRDGLKFLDGGIEWGRARNPLRT